MRNPDLAPFWKTWARYAKIIAIWGLGTVLVGIAAGSVAFAIGGLCGGLVAWFNFRLLAQDITKEMDMAPSAAQRYAASRYMLRYTATGAVLAVLAWQEKLGMPAFLAALVPLLSIKLTIYAEMALQTVLGWLQRDQDQDSLE